MEKTELSLMDTNSKLSNNTAVILVSHGSTLPFAEEVFEDAKNYAAKLISSKSYTVKAMKEKCFYRYC